MTLVQFAETEGRRALSRLQSNAVVSVSVYVWVVCACVCMHTCVRVCFQHYGVGLALNQRAYIEKE